MVDTPLLLAAHVHLFASRDYADRSDSCPPWQPGFLADVAIPISRIQDLCYHIVLSSHLANSPEALISPGQPIL